MSTEFSHLLNDLPLFKSAADDADFEVAFSSLAHGQLEDSVPSLMRYLVGFQTLKAEEDKGRSVGIAGFKIKKNWLYVPAFFINGQIKGMDMLYSRASNMFVPLNDNWVGYILSKQPGEMGKKELKNETDLHIISPDFLSAYTGAGMVNKHAAVEMQKLASIARDIDVDSVYKLVKTARHTTADLHYWTDRVPDFKVVLAKTASERPEFAAALALYYDINELFRPSDKVASAVDRARRSRPVKQAAMSFTNMMRNIDWSTERRRGGVVKVSSSNVHMFGDQLSEDEKSAVYAGAETYLDTRVNANLAYHREKVAEALDALEKPDVRTRESSPSETVAPSVAGEYDVLLATGDTKKMFVSPQVRMLTAAEGKDRAVIPAFVYDSGSGEGRIVGTSKIVCLPPSKGIGDGKDLSSEAIPLSEMKAGLNYALLFQDGSVSNIFQRGGKKTGEAADTYQVGHVRSVYEPTGDDYQGYSYSSLPLCGRNAYSVYYDEKHFDEAEKVEWKGHTFSISPSAALWDNTGKNIPTIVQRHDDPDTTIMVRGIMAVVGSGVKAIPVGIEWGYDAANKTKFPALGSIQVLWDTVFNPANTVSAELKSAADGRVVVDIDHTRTAGTRTEAMDRLIFEGGLREKQARAIMDRYEETNNVPLSIVKDAAPGQPKDSEIGAPWPVDFPTTHSDLLGRSVQEPHDLDVLVPGAQSQSRIDYPYSIFEDEEVKSVLSAANSGEKDVFDVAALSGLVKSVDISGVIDEYLPDLQKAEDRLGRLRFIMLWHIDKLEERFGQQELVDLEDHLKNNFDSLGETILFLQQKANDSNPAHLSMDDGKLDLG